MFSAEILKICEQIMCMNDLSLLIYNHRLWLQPPFFYILFCFKLLTAFIAQQLLFLIILVMIHSDDNLSLQAAPLPHQPPPPLSGCLRLLCGTLGDAGWNPHDKDLLGPGWTHVCSVFFPTCHPYLCLCRKHGAHISWPLCGYLRPSALPCQDHWKSCHHQYLSVLDLLCFLQHFPFIWSPETTRQV